MGPTKILIEEHKAVKVILDALASMCRKLGSGEKVDPDHFEKVIVFIKNVADRGHHMKEEDLLFARMESAGVSREEMLADTITTEHDLSRGYIRGISDALVSYSMGDMSAGRVISENATSYVNLLRDHIVKEEEVIFPLADKHLPDEVQRELVAAFEKIDSDVIGPAKLEEYMGILNLLRDTYLEQV
jgi:hemerythrin-like domain-containing protein